MAQLKNLDKLFDLDEGQALVIGNNRIAVRFPHDTPNARLFSCTLHGHEIARVVIYGAASAAHVYLHDRGYPTVTTRNAMQDFARAFGCTLSVSFAKGGMSARFKNGAGHYADRACVLGAWNGPYAMGRNV